MAVFWENSRIHTVHAEENQSTKKKIISVKKQNKKKEKNTKQNKEDNKTKTKQIDTKENEANKHKSHST